MAFRWWWSQVVDLLLLVPGLGAQGIHIETRMLGLWLKLIVPVGVRTEGELVELHERDGIVEYFNKVIFADRSSGSFDATG